MDCDPVGLGMSDRVGAGQCDVCEPVWVVEWVLGVSGAVRVVRVGSCGYWWVRVCLVWYVVDVCVRLCGVCVCVCAHGCVCRMWYVRVCRWVQYPQFAHTHSKSAWGVGW